MQLLIVFAAGVGAALATAAYLKLPWRDALILGGAAAAAATFASLIAGFLATGLWLLLGLLIVAGLVSYFYLKRQARAQGKSATQLQLENSSRRLVQSFGRVVRSVRSSR